MKATTNIDVTAGTNGNGNPVPATGKASEEHHGAAGQVQAKGKPESQLRAAARRKGLTLKQLAYLMGVNYGYLSSVASGCRPWSPMLRERATEILGEVPGQGVVYRRGGLVQGESTFIRERARELGLSQKDLAERVGVSVGYMSEVARGRKNMSPTVQARVERVLGAPVKVAPAVCANRQGGLVKGKNQSSFIRERARERGFTLKGLAEHVGVSVGYMSQASRGERNMSPGIQAKVEAALDGPARVEAAQRPTVDPHALWERMDAHGYSQNQVARLAGISTGHLSQIMNGQRTPSGDVLRRLHAVLFAPATQERVAPVDLKVMAWKKGSRNGVVVRGAGGPHSGSTPGGGTVRIGGRVPWGAEVEYAYTTGYDTRGRLSVNHIIDERDCSALLKQPEQYDA